MRSVQSGIRKVQAMGQDELMAEAKALGAPLDLLIDIHKTGKLPVVNFAAGGVATPADAALMMHLGAEGVFVGSGIFKSSDPEARAKAVVKAVTHYKDPKILAEVSKGLGEAMSGKDVRTMKPEELLATRGW
jgi:pyridoxal 5'-phosphate synthase pdxS subunit